jgi:hypothetical protein
MGTKYIENFSLGNTSIFFRWDVIRENIEGVIAPNFQHFLSGLGGAEIVTFFFTEQGFFVFCHYKK